VTQVRQCGAFEPPAVLRVSQQFLVNVVSAKRIKLTIPSDTSTTVQAHVSPFQRVSHQLCILVNVNTEKIKLKTSSDTSTTVGTCD